MPDSDKLGVNAVQQGAAAENKATNFERWVKDHQIQPKKVAEENEADRVIPERIENNSNRGRQFLGALVAVTALVPGIGPVAAATCVAAGTILAASGTKIIKDMIADKKQANKSMVTTAAGMPEKNSKEALLQKLEPEQERSNGPGKHNTDLTERTIIKAGNIIHSFLNPPTGQSTKPMPPGVEIATPSAVPKGGIQAPVKAATER